MVKAKSRLVARGFKQREGVDFGETFAPTVSSSCVRLLSAIACAGACVCWFSRTQKCVTLSTSEAEYVALGDAVKELLFLRQVWRFMIPGKGTPCFPVFEDNQGALQLSKNPVSTSNSKHIDVRHHFLRELVRQGDIIVNHVPSEYQHADILTKVLAFDLFAIHRRFLMNLSD